MLERYSEASARFYEAAGAKYKAVAIGYGAALVTLGGIIGNVDDPNFAIRALAVPLMLFAIALALAIVGIRAANLIGPPYPSARDLAPRAYRSLGVENRGQIAEVLDDERDALMDLAITPLELQFSPDVTAYMALAKAVGQQTPKSINVEAMRMANLILGRIAKGGELSTRMNPIRTGPDFSVLFALLVRKWQDDQRGACALCRGPLVAQTNNAMLQPSADRIDSANPAYDETNVQITHLACNLAKNKWGVEHFEEWATVVRGLGANVDDESTMKNLGAAARVKVHA